MLSAVLREFRDTFGPWGVAAVFAGIARRAVAKAKGRITARRPAAKLAQLTEMLGEAGVVAAYSIIDGGFALSEHNCPYADVVKEHPEVCSVIHTVLDETIGGQHVQTESLATGGVQCRFEIRVPSNAGP